MSTFAACGHKAEWICKSCASCSVCDKCYDAGDATDRFVHINTKEAAMALGRWAWKKRQEWQTEAERQDRGEPLDSKY